MTTRWITVAPVQYSWGLPEDIVLPFKIGENVFFSELPDWVRTEDFLNLVCSSFREELNDIKFCIMVEYEAEALGSPDPHWQGEKPIAIQQSALDKIHYVNLALWLVKPSGFNFNTVFHVQKNGKWSLRELSEVSPLCPLPDYEDVEHTKADFELATKLYESLRGLAIEDTVHTAVQSTIRALMETGWTLRYLLFWLAVESLFGATKDRGETAYRLSQRVAFFLGENPEQAHSLFLKVKSGYKWRSNIVHGLRLSKLTSDKSKDLLLELEGYVRNAMLKILTDIKLITFFEGKDRESFLDDLIFVKR